jgi:Fe-S-cluster-containing dehydrogenase component
VRGIAGLDGRTTRFSVASQCRHCDEPPCAEACIVDAIVKDEDTGLVRFDWDECIECWSCIEACPFEAIHQVPGAEEAVRCDRCEDREAPACVDSCPTGALVFTEFEEFKGTLDDYEKIISSNESRELQRLWKSGHSKGDLDGGE